MGVHGLWRILARSERKTSLDELSGNVLAVDLSGWVCQASTYMNPLRNLFFRIHHLYCHGASLVFVIDGEVPPLKKMVMMSRGYDSTRASFRLKMEKCCDLLRVLGVPFLQSNFEAEAYCALLNSVGVVNGTISEDGDTFLYGGKTLYRNLSTNEKNPHISCYEMDVIQEKLGLTRDDLVALALLLGCDYCPRGVPGVGKKIALQLLRALKRYGQSNSILDRFRRWTFKEFGEDEVVSSVEKYVRSKALDVPGFPNEEVIQEFLVLKDSVPVDIVSKLQWQMPSLVTLQEFCAEHLKWRRQYTLQKSANLLTQWVLRQPRPLSCVHSVRIVRERMHCGENCYEIEWMVDATVYQGFKLTTLEGIEKFKTVFPEVHAVFDNEAYGKKISGKKKGHSSKNQEGLQFVSGKNHSSEADSSDEEERAFASMRKRRKTVRL